MESLKNKVVLITGASSGIGKACAYAFAKEGANLLLAARRLERLNEISKIIMDENKIKILTVEIDVRNYENLNKTFSNLTDEWKRIDILINNAGLAKGSSPFYEGEIDDWEEMIDTNIKGLLYVTRQILPQMVERNTGHIINIGSTAGHEVYKNGNVYCATKFAVNASRCT
jgi:3-hydroxy acid dehydrogenase/malonic semialdehyde reductase